MFQILNRSDEMNDNQLKAIAGSLSKQNLLEELKTLQCDEYIVYCTADFRAGYSDFSPEQFYAPFYIEFRNGDGWLLFSTNSIRTDRINIQQWNSYHLRQIKKNITHAFIVVPNEIVNNEKELSIAKKYNLTITSGNFFTALDGVYTVSEIIDLIKKAY